MDLSTMETWPRIDKGKTVWVKSDMVDDQNFRKWIEWHPREGHVQAWN